MDRKTILVLVISFGLIFLWQKLVVQKYYPQKPGTNLVHSATNQISTNGVLATNLATSTNELQSPAASRKIDVAERTLALTNQNAVYIFSSHGGGLKLIEFQKYRADVECGRAVKAERRPATLNTAARVPVLAITGADALLGDEIYDLSTTPGGGVQAVRELENGLKITKTFELSTNYLIKANLRIENGSQQPVQVPQREITVGTSTPMSAHDLGMEMGLFWFNGAESEHIGPNLGSSFGCSSKPRPEYVSATASSNVVWGAVHNRFFTIAAIPSQPANQLISRRVELRNSRELLDANVKAITNGLQTALVYPAAIVAPGSAVENAFTIYAGPKEYNTLARLGEQMKNKLDDLMAFGFFGIFAKGLLLSMNWLHSAGVSYGIAIIVITILIKLVFWPLTNASTKSMKRMQLLQPQMKALQEKYKDDPRKMNMKLMEFMKEHKVSPLGGCLPMLIQIPIFIGFYQMLRSAIELRDVSFLWACDLSQADTIAYVSGFPINPLPVIWGVTMLWQATMTPASPGMDPTQQKIMKYMPLMILFFLYNMPAGLTLYWTVQNLLTILQMKLTKATDVPAAAPAKPAPTAPKKKK